MRPLRYSINVTLDGCCDHREIPADEELHRHAVENLAQADALLFGRVTYEMMEAAWRSPRTGEMEQVIPGADPGDPEMDPIIEASELNAARERGAAEDVLMKVLAEDLRCLNAHSHLGNFAFEHNTKQAMRHYMVGALTLGTDFDGVLPWGLIDNRPFLRCIHGVGLCFWRLGDMKEAEKTFIRMLWLNPSDNQGARFNLANVEAGHSWEECEEREA